MRGWAMVLAVVVVAGAGGDDARAWQPVPPTPPKPPPPPLIDQAIKDAAAAEHPLVVELYAAWCRPCRWFEAKVLARADVQAAVEAVDFVRYDIDTPEGAAVVRRYRTTAVPTFLVLDAHGAVVERIAGLQGRGVRAADAEAQVTAWFIDLVTSARAHADELGRLRDAVAADPRDAASQLDLARYYRRSAMPAQAVTAYRAITAATPPLTGELVAIAQGELDDLEAADRRVDDAVETALAFAARFPASRLTTARLALAGASGRVAAAEIERRLERHLAAVVPGADLAEGIRLALALRLHEVAAAAIERWRREFPRAALLELVLAERDLLAGDYDAADGRLGKVCAPPAPGIELQCYVLGAAVRESWRGAPGVRRILSTAANVIHGLEVPGDGDRGGALEIDDLAAVDLELGNAIARSLRLAESACGARAEAPGEVRVAVHLAGTAGTPHTVEAVAVGAGGADGGAADIGAPAQRCVERVVAATALPRAAIDAGDVLHGRVELAPDWRTTRIAPRAPAATIGAFVRTGDLAAAGLDAHGVAGLGVFADFRAMIDAEVELGADADRELIGAARTMLGLGIGSHRWQFAALIGVGVSRVDAMLPTAAEVPFELRVDGPLGAHRLRLWARGAWLFGAAAREREQGSALFSADETAVGIAIAARRFYVGAVTEGRAAGTSAMFVIGTPFGSGL
jgi:thiol-disulfide isomerase/thioredoxin